MTQVDFQLHVIGTIIGIVVGLTCKNEVKPKPAVYSNIGIPSYQVYFSEVAVALGLTLVLKG